jgi:lipopolysaccharide transport system ATP-binding protein
MGKSDIDRRFDEIVEFSGVERFIDTPVKRYSSGMQVRLAFSVAAHLEPDVLLVDEVLAVGDSAFQKKCLGRMDQVAEEGRTIIFVSHNMAAVKMLCKRGVLLEGGNITADGPMDQTLESYLGSDSRKVPEVQWDDLSKAPGDDRVRLSSVRLRSGKAISASMEYRSPFQIEVEYVNNEPGIVLSISIHIRDSQGNLVFTTGNVPSASITVDPWHGKPQPVGIYRSVCTIPGALLNEGLHHVTVFINGEFVKETIVRQVDLLSFEIIDSERSEREFSGEWLGIIRPILHWDTNKLGS